jgi:hypothetical protein
VEEGVKQPKPGKVRVKVGYLKDGTPYICWADMRWTLVDTLAASPGLRWILVEARPFKRAKKRGKGKR